MLGKSADTFRNLNKITCYTCGNERLSKRKLKFDLLFGIKSKWQHHLKSSVHVIESIFVRIENF